jgi:SAM-dependent methyltransferase
MPPSIRQFISALRRHAGKLVRSSAKSFACPICDSDFQEFFPLSPFYRQQWKLHGFDIDALQLETLNEKQYSCPICGASDRDRLYALFLKERMTQPTSSFRLIDFAPAQSLSNFITRSFKINYRTADLFMLGVDDRVDLTNMPIYETETVDAFICSHILEHIPDDQKALSELYRILKPGGWGILMVPICCALEEIEEDPSKSTTEEDRWKYFGQDDHVRLYSKKGFLRRISNAGFKVSPFNATHYGIETFKRFGITLQSCLYIVSK